MIYSLEHLKPIDYLLVGHLTLDLVEGGVRLGGSVAYAGLTAQALGMRVGIISSFGDDLSLDPLGSIPVVHLPALASTTFSNHETPKGRVQRIFHCAETLEYYLVPEIWRRPLIVHLAPVAQEVSPDFVRHFAHSFIGVTPQGWLRAWDAEGNVYPTEWPESTFVLPHVDATVISVEDVAGSEDMINEFAASCHILAVTEGAGGSRVFWNGEVRCFRPPPNILEVDPVGAGDIYAAAFFIRLYETRDPWEAGRFATQLASFSVTRAGLESIPTQREIEQCLVEVC
ncbi:MAG: PfkB family carbohydrate kinase [Anaerolineales bacterium]|nr:PfkB family carbohydrate kinase [Anaerolineales bacterium]MCS7248141.1 PfkB family carbohydrate kinase [Anaerolineales bacterium]MDW8161953.1 PfkB family carbohydrate kinase [Anaerolineales bacterium]MDW8447184.1 PfkB family carbohydrate kinase [Anaerolineales bacterium]